MDTMKAIGRVIVKPAVGALVSIDCLDGSTATKVTATDAGCECIQQCPHGSVGKSIAFCLVEDAVPICTGWSSPIAFSEISTAHSISISSICMSPISMPAMS